MYFATYKYDRAEEIGVVLKEDKRIIPIKDIFKAMDKDYPETMNDFIEIADDTLIKDMEEIMGFNNFKGIEEKDVKLCAPIPYPKRNIICLGKNYIDHAKETQGLPGGTDDIPKFPIYFSKIASPAIGDGDIILNHLEITDMVDYEVELAVIIGKDGINIKKEEVEDYIFGYTIVNDISARNIQRKHGQWFKGKSLETHCPMGPYIAYKNEIPFPVELDIACKVNDELRQNSNTKNLIFDIPYIINDLSKGMRLKAGDIVITGTPAGVGLGFKPFKFLKPGDKVECYIEKIGTLTNKFEE
ncbi:fumarylacetoacetate hydrolase family protein [Paramaledivibacter caminithermalis]|jgi:2-keto-4-pentenoate hydratase/2-oxohepta-3-ene-1,7-dioic acid hydratase in catechol pathway|uniref:2-keto-4-pentenoate hydratase/2-oxohepta-3-ene-1,7-dioic acid hydratase (Catechol pathway) n=1 Tax=Paramaledivibacter caminithermalis (strain DSM 15212 / CIP 107654 / DViRD3) TaxID=1121301 RepID=A0A1M6LQB4_PARC5|nr:fumarylacetoacetate hydrolase family protein [Paramaledivibacter caminithermalis]SHJ73345.1 2-keto-4-pentenoate hydratase/2-oxohepta-3-ene-1,7-dioic acid hydratase (catechol pathway) [Paramaledivibacter caminithermalis DSM 15212]